MKEWHRFDPLRQGSIDLAPSQTGCPICGYDGPNHPRCRRCTLRFGPGHVAGDETGLLCRFCRAELAQRGR